MNNPEAEKSLETPGKVTFLDGQGELPMLEVSTRWADAEIYLHGAHVTGFQKRREPPLLFMSQCSRFESGHPIRGGIPVIVPWFGMREGLGQHGFGRNVTWELREVRLALDGRVSAHFRLPDCPEAGSFPPFRAEYEVTVGEALELRLTVTNESPDEPLTFENCLHTYFLVSDVTAISIQGLHSAKYLDKTANFAEKVETAESIRIGGEVDRTYINTTTPVTIHDPRYGRKILVEKEDSASTVVWNPWVQKAQEMRDFGNDEYQRMVCVESGNVGPNQLSLPPRGSSTLTVRLSSQSGLAL